METQNQIHCPKCNSTQIYVDKKGFSGRKAAVGAIATGGIGLLAGTIGSNKIVLNCLNCGNKFKPGEKYVDKPKYQYLPKQLTDEQKVKNRKNNKIIGYVFMPLFFMIGLVLLISNLYFFGSLLIVIGFFFLMVAIKS